MNVAALRALTLDLDDTLWPVAPALREAEKALDDWLREHYPQVAERFPIESMRALRERIAIERADLAHDLSRQRKLTLEHAFRSCGVCEPPIEAAFEIYFAARNRVTPYADSVDALIRIRRHLPVVSLSNGNADLERIGLGYLFHDQINASRVGVAKPHAKIFRQACARLDAKPATVLHIGDDPRTDIDGARAAGLRTGWINRGGQRFTGRHRPDLEFSDLTQLADWLEATVPQALMA